MSVPSLITGCPSAYKAGRRMLLVGYVSMGEWQTFGELVKLDEGRAVLRLAYWSLHRADPTMTRRKVCRLMRNTKFGAALMTLICDLSIPKIAGQDETPSDKESDRNVKTAYRQLSMMYGWTPAAISDMSPVQIYQYQTGGKDGTGIQKMSGAEYQSFRARRGGLN